MEWPACPACRTEGVGGGDDEWQATLAPRAGEHVFSGGLYRDVWTVTTDAVHEPWTGTRVTTRLRAPAGVPLGLAEMLVSGALRTE